MLKSWGIRDRLLLLAIMPPALIAIIVGGYLIDTRVQDVERAHGDLGQMVANQLAPASEFGIATGDRSVLEHLATAALSDPDVLTVVIRDAEGNELARARREPPTAGEQSWLERVMQTNAGGNERTFIAPIGMARRDDGQPVAGSLGQAEVHVSRARTQARQWQVRLTGTLTTLAVLLISLLLALHVSRGISAPMRRLAEGVRALQEGRFSHRVTEGSGGELGTLERGINRMAAALQSGRHELRSRVDQATVELRSTLEELEVKNVELDLARRRAIDASRSKSEFLANISHEIRTPVNGILGFTRLLQQTRLDNEQTEYVHIINRSATSLLGIINDVLDFSRVDDNKLIVEQVDIHLPELVEDTVALLAPQAYEKGLELVCLIYSDVPSWVRGDPVRLRQILTNLLGNAIKFTRSGHVAVRVMSEQDTAQRATVTVSVTDTGIGIAPADQEHIFKAFTQADSSATRRFGGTGLGLFISDRLIQAMGGKIGFRSRQGEGSRFWFTLSLDKVVQVDTPPPEGLGGEPVLLFESFHLASLSLRHTLESWGAQVTETDSIPALLEAAAARPPRVVVLGLPAADFDNGAGGDVLSRLSPLELPCLVLVNSTDRALHQRVRNAGAAVCLPRATRRCQLHQGLQDILRGIATPGPADAGESTPSTPAFADMTDRRLAGLRVLAADDNRINLHLLATLLQRHGAEVERAADGEEALEHLRHGRFDCVLMDVHMPSLSGTDATRELRRTHQNASTPVIAVTANAVPGEQERLKAAGMDDSLVKPLDEEHLVQTVLRWTGQTRDGEPATQNKPAQAAPEVQEPDPMSLAMLLEDLPAHRDAMLAALGEDDLEQAVHYAHLIHGSAAFCRLPQLREAAAAAEKALRQPTPAPERRRRADALAQEIDRFIASHLGAASTTARDGS